MNASDSSAAPGAARVLRLHDRPRERERCARAFLANGV
jgi:hypothetical protein